MTLRDLTWLAVLAVLAVAGACPALVDVAEAQNKAPKANFQANPTRGDVPLTVQFTDGSSDQDGRIVQFHWEFGDGATSQEQNPAHLYPLPGRYDVTLTVTDNAGATDTITNQELIIVDPPRLLTAVLPISRSIQFHQTATAFVSVINTGAITATAVGISIHESTQPPVPVALTFQTTDSHTNEVTGAPNNAVDIPPGATQSYVVALTPSAPFGPSEVRFDIKGTNTDTARIVSGVNTLLLSASTAATPDVVALATTVDNNGLLRIAGQAGASAAFAVATVNLAAGDTITVAADTGASGPAVDLSLCRTDAAGQCIGNPGPSVSTAIGNGETPTFAIFVTATGVIAFDPVHNRVFVRFTDPSGATRGATSVAVRTQ